MEKIAYLFSTFPAMSTTFVQTQVRESINQGLDAFLVANHPPKKGGWHPQDADLRKNTIYLSQLGVAAYTKAHAKAIARWPKGYAKAIKLALALDDGYPWQRTKNLVHLAVACVLADILSKERITHIHAHFAFGAAGVAVFLQTLTGIDWSLSVHGSDALLPRPLVLEKIKRAKFIISNSQYLISRLKERFPQVCDKKFFVVPYGVNTLLRPWSKHCTLPQDKTLRIINIARLEPVKAQDLLIRACARLKKANIAFKCDIIGDGPLKNELDALIKKLGLESQVHLRGPMYQDKVAQMLDQSHVMALSSKSEGTPMTIVEAMAKARPVIAPNITGIPEMITHGKTGLLFKKGSVSDLADCLTKLAQNPELMKIMGQNSRKYAEKKYDLKKNASQLVDIFLNN